MTKDSLLKLLAERAKTIQHDREYVHADEETRTELNKRRRSGQVPSYPQDFRRDSWLWDSELEWIEHLKRKDD